MKLTTIALATAFALSSTFALAQSGGATGSSAGASTGGASMSGTKPRPKARRVWGSRKHYRHGDAEPEQHHESVRKHAGSQWLAQRIDLGADRSRFRNRPLALLWQILLKEAGKQHLTLRAS